MCTGESVSIVVIFLSTYHFTLKIYNVLFLLNWQDLPVRDEISSVDGGNHCTRSLLFLPFVLRLKILILHTQSVCRKRSSSLVHVVILPFDTSSLP